MAEWVLIGGPAAGKSTVGAALAERLDVPFHDADDVIVARSRMSIPEIFQTHGEPHFRELEFDVISTLLTEPGVLSLGGGAVLREDLRRALATAAHQVVWLRCSAETGVSRVGDGSTRPLLAGDPAARLRQLHQQRAGLYRQVADVIIDTDQLDVASVVDEILKVARQ